MRPSLPAWVSVVLFFLRIALDPHSGLAQVAAPTPGSSSPSGSTMALGRRVDFWVDKNLGNDAHDGSEKFPWKTLSKSYEKLKSFAAADPSGKMFTLHVVEGIYSTANGEQFPVKMHPRARIVGENTAFNTLIEGGGSEGFRFCFDPMAFWDSECQKGPFHASKGAYLDNLSIRGFGIGISLYGAKGSGGVEVNPLLTRLVISGCGIGVLAEIASPVLYDDTITQNGIGLYNTILIPAEDCCSWTIRNCIVSQMTGAWDLWNIGFSEISYSNFDPNRVFLDAPAAQCGKLLPCSSFPPDPLCLFNVYADPGFRNAFPDPNPNLVSGLKEEHDFRLGSNSMLRGLGFDNGLLFDGEGAGNRRRIPYATAIPGTDIGADQYDMFQFAPLARGTDPQSGLQIGLDAQRLTIEAEGTPNDPIAIVTNDFSLLPKPPGKAKSLPPFLGQFWIEPFLQGAFSIGAIPPSSTSLWFSLPISPSCPGVSGPFGCLPYGPGFPRASAHALGFGAPWKISNLQNYPLVF